MTGSNGGIGSAICKSLIDKGYLVVGTDVTADKNALDKFIQWDLNTLVHDKSKRRAFECQIYQAIEGTSLSGLVNNAAIQLLGNLSEVNIDEFVKSLNVNVSAPLVLSKLLYPELKKSNGSIVNIGSIHSKLTKPEFISYATSKAALLGLTQAMAVDAGANIRVNIIQPAATATDMLVAGFDGNTESLNKLKAYHPTNSIGTPFEVANAVAFLLSDCCHFMNGASLDINGGIAVRLHDPS